MKLIIKDNYELASEWGANHIANAINNHKENRPFVLGLPTGSSPLGIYKKLIEMNKAGKVSFKNVVTFNKFELSTPDVTVKVDPEHRDLVSVQTVGGEKYVMIRVTGCVEVNGINVKIED